MAAAGLAAGRSMGGAGSAGPDTVGVAVRYDRCDGLADVIFDATGYST